MRVVQINRKMDKSFRGILPQIRYGLDGAFSDIRLIELEKIKTEGALAAPVDLCCPLRYCYSPRLIDPDPVAGVILEWCANAL